MLYECEVNTDIWNALGKHIILGYGTDMIQQQFRHIKVWYGIILFDK